MIDESCGVPRENLDDGFNPCRRQVVENGELCQYAHMYDVMNERYDREGETSYLDSAKRDRITYSTPSQTVGEGKLYAQNAQGVEGFIKSSETLDPTTHAEIPSSKAVADYVPIPLPISKGGTGGNTPYVTDDLDSSAIFVMHDAPNDRYDAAPMSALINYLVTLFPSLDSSRVIPEYSDLNDYINLGAYGLTSAASARTISNRPNITPHGFKLFVYDTVPSPGYTSQLYLDLFGNIAQRHIDNGVWGDWNILTEPSIPNPLPVNMGGTGAQTAATALTSLGVPQEISNAFASHTATTVADDDLLPTNALMIDYVNAHSLDTPPSKFSFQVSPFPSDTLKGEMTINVTPVFSAKIGGYTYVLARVHAYKRFNYTGTADNINLFTSLKPVGDYTGDYIGSSCIPITFNVIGRSNTDGAYGLTPKGSAANLALNSQTVSSVFNMGNFDISSNLKCVFGDGTNTPSVTVSIDCPALMLYSAS